MGEGDSAPDPISFFACVSGDRDRREKARPAGGGGKEREEINGSRPGGTAHQAGLPGKRFMHRRGAERGGWGRGGGVGVRARGGGARGGRGKRTAER